MAIPPNHVINIGLPGIESEMRRVAADWVIALVAGIQGLMPDFAYRERQCEFMRPAVPPAIEELPISPLVNASRPTPAFIRRAHTDIAPESSNSYGFGQFWVRIGIYLPLPRSAQAFHAAAFCTYLVRLLGSNPDHMSSVSVSPVETMTTGASLNPSERMASASSGDVVMSTSW